MNRKLVAIAPFLVLPLTGSAVWAQQTGQAHPDLAGDTAYSTPQQPDHYVKPGQAATVPAVPPAPAYKDSFAATGPAPVASPAPITSTPAETTAAPEAPVLLHHAPAETDTPTSSARRDLAHEDENMDGAIVTSVPNLPHELNDGTVLKARLRETLSTADTRVGSPFSAELIAPAMHQGSVLLPVGAVIHGRISAVHGGKRIGGAASLRLQPESVSLPDGTSYPLQATLAGLAGVDDARVNDEGTIRHQADTKLAVGGLSLTTGSAAVAGAVVGGGVGAAVGAGIGAGLGAIWFSKRDVQQTIPSGTDLLFSLDEPLNVQSRASLR